MGLPPERTEKCSGTRCARSRLTRAGQTSILTTPPTSATSFVTHASSTIWSGSGSASAGATAQSPGADEERDETAARRGLALRERRRAKGVCADSHVIPACRSTGRSSSVNVVAARVKLGASALSHSTAFAEADSDPEPLTGLDLPIGLPSARSLDAGSVVPRRKPGNPGLSRDFLDGARRARTADLLGAIQALSQLSYSPSFGRTV